MVMLERHGLSEFSKAKEGDLVLFIHENIRFAQLFRIRELFVWR